MTTNRANQTWPEDVMTNLQPYTEEWAEEGYSDYYVTQSPVTSIWYVRRVSDGQVFEERETREGAVLALRRRDTQGQEPLDEFERRQRGSAGTIAALFLVALFAICAIAVFPMFAALANVAK